MGGEFGLWEEQTGGRVLYAAGVSPLTPHTPLSLSDAARTCSPRYGDAALPTETRVDGGEMASAQGRRRLQARAAAVSAVAMVCALVTACTQPSTPSVPQPQAVTVSGSPAPVPEELESFYSQTLRWYPCGEGDSVTENSAGDFFCAQATVPLDYDNPGGQTITIAMKKRPASDKAIGTLFVNPGGPGGSGVELVDSVQGYFSRDLTAAYDIVGFDPRGVGASTAVDCLTDAELDDERANANDTMDNSELGSAQIIEAVGEQTREFEAQCEQRTSTPGLLDHIDTVSAARDLDILRVLVGDSALSYLGYSYGTYLGATYADIFPASVGRMVLDGAIDPSLNAGELTLGQAEGFEQALRAFVEDCQGTDACPLTGTVDNGVKQIQDFFAHTRTSPVPTSDAQRPLTDSLAKSAVIGVMYQDEAWPVLREGLHQAMLQNDGSTLLYIADLFASRNEDGTYSGNGDEVIGAINCLDYPVEGTPEQWGAEAKKLEDLSPTFGSELGYSDAMCQAWGHQSTRERKQIHAVGTPDILVIGTTGDPATRYQWAQALASQLDRGHLLTWEGQGHTAYGRAGKCVTKAVDGYLLSGTLPEEGLVCHGRE